MGKVYDAEVIRQRLNHPMARRVIFSLLVKKPDMDRRVQQQSVNRTLILFLEHGMLAEALKFERWWSLAQRGELTLSDIRFETLNP